MSKQSLFIPGPVGKLEALYYLPDNPDLTSLAVICHPDPTQRGTMNNKVITTTAKAFNSKNIPVLTFNYRGVEASQGRYGNIVGELDDAKAVIKFAKEKWNFSKLYLAGFSFGAYIAAEMSVEENAAQLISIAPSVERMPYDELSTVNCPWLVIQGEIDDVVSPNAVYAWFEGLSSTNKQLIRFPETGHFFHGKLPELTEVLTAAII